MHEEEAELERHHVLARGRTEKMDLKSVIIKPSHVAEAEQLSQATIRHNRCRW